MANGTLKVSNIETSSGSGTITIGQSGETVDLSNGTITGRMTHRNPNMAQVPAVYSPYGKECRACWIVAEGYKLVGVDASGLELRIFSYLKTNQNSYNLHLNKPF